MPDIRRIKWNQIWLPRYFYQHVYVPMLYCAVSLASSWFVCLFVSLVLLVLARNQD